MIIFFLHCKSLKQAANDTLKLACRQAVVWTGVATKCAPIWDQQSFYSTDPQWDEVEGKFWRNLQILEPLPLLQRVNTRGGLIMQSVCIIGTLNMRNFQFYMNVKNSQISPSPFSQFYMVRLWHIVCFFIDYLNRGGVQLSSPINMVWPRFDQRRSMINITFTPW